MFRSGPINRNDWKKKMHCPHRPQKDILLQQECKKLSDRLASLSWKVEQHNKYKPIVVFFEDEGRFGRISREMYCWLKRI
jgi:hypothetical protein